MDGKAGMIVAHGLFRAARQRLNLWVAGASTASAVVFQSWTFLALTATGYAGLVLWDLSHGKFWRETADELRRRPAALPDVVDVMDATARQFIHRIASARGELVRVLRQRPEGLPERMSAQLAGLRELEERAVLLVYRLEELSRYLSDKSPESLRREIERLTRYGEFTAHARLKIEYGRARATLEEELATLQELFAARELIVARLETLAGALETFPCQIVRIHVATEQNRDEGDDVLLDPRCFLAEARSLEETLTRCLTSDEAFEGRTPAVRGLPGLYDPGRAAV
jgi:hypothetical protein